MRSILQGKTSATNSAFETMSKKKLGPYTIDQVVGRGGMGTVYAAIDERTGDPAAVKILSESLVDDEHFRERFAAEIEALKLLRHPHIVQLYGYGEQNGNLFYAMELIQGRSLFDELNSGRRFSWSEVVRIGVETSLALRHAHDSGVIHRDLKPANLLLDTQGRIKLSDFGIAKLFGGAKLTSDGGVMGTADYMSPEQASGSPATTRSDLYSLGSVMFALLAGRPPFNYKSLPEVIHALKFEEPPSLGRFVAEVPEELETIILRLLSKDPEQRIPTAQALANRLQEIDASPASPDSGDLSSTQSVSVTSEFRSEEDSIAAAPTVDAPLADDAPAEDLSPDSADRLETVDNVFDVKDHSLEDSPLPDERPTRFTEFSERDHRFASADVGQKEGVGSKVLKSLALLLIVAAMVAMGIYVAWPESSDALYARITAAGNSGRPERLRKSKDHVSKFLDRFPDDPRRDVVIAQQQEIELLELQESFQRRVQLGVSGKSLSLVERAYLDAIQLAKNDPATAAIKLEALIDLFGSETDAPEETLRIVTLARRQADELKSLAESFSTVQLMEIENHLLRAEKLASDDVQAALAIWKGIVELYADKPWADEAVNRARESLAQQE